MIYFLIALIIPSRSLSICSEAIESVLSASHHSLLANSSFSEVLEYIEYSGKFINELGHYEACKRKENSEYFLFESAKGIRLSMGVCLPKECSLEQVQSFVQDYSSGQITAKKPYHSEISGFGWFLIFLIVLFIAAGVLSSFYDFSNKKSLLFSVIHSFSLKNNFNSLMIVRQAKEGDGSGILEFIRFISLLSVVATHSISFKSNNPVYNIEEYGEIYRQWWRFFGYCAEMAVDTFFWVGGFLLGYLLLQEVEKKRGRFGVLGWILVYCHRFARILPVYAFVLGFYMNIFPALGDGPNWKSIKIVTNECSEYWWSVLTFTNNFVPNGLGNQCLGVGWYLANDMQFFALGPILIMIYYKTRRSISWSLQFVLILLGFVISYWIAYDHDFRVLLPAGKNRVGGKEDYYHLYYTKPYTRFFPYLVGLYSGYVYLKYYTRNVLKVEDSHKDKIADSILWLMKDKTFGTISFVAGSLLTWYMFDMSGTLCEHVLNDDYWSRTANAIWLPLRHILYSYGLTFALLPIMIGRFPWIYQFMTAKLFTPLGKISFTCFLVQFGTLFWVFAQDRAPDHLNGKTVFKDITVGILLTLMFSLPVHLLVEVPFANIEKIICSLLVRPRRSQ